MAELNGVVMFHFGKYFVLHFGTEHWDWWLQHDTFVNSFTTIYEMRVLVSGPLVWDICKSEPVGLNIPENSINVNMLCIYFV